VPIYCSSRPQARATIDNGWACGVIGNIRPCQGQRCEFEPRWVHQYQIASRKRSWGLTRGARAFILCLTLTRHRISGRLLTRPPFLFRASFCLTYQEFLVLPRIPVSTSETSSETISGSPCLVRGCDIACADRSLRSSGASVYSRHVSVAGLVPNVSGLFPSNSSHRFYSATAQI
jgi:hypothetical protein